MRFANAPRALNEPACCKSSSLKSTRNAPSPKSAPSTSMTGVLRMKGSMTLWVAAMRSRLMPDCCMTAPRCLGALARAAVDLYRSAHGQRGNRDGGARRIRRIKLPRVHCIHPCKVVPIPKIHTAAHDLGECLARCAQHRANIDKHLLDLRRHICRDEHAARASRPDLTAYGQQLCNTHGCCEGAIGGASCWLTIASLSIQYCPRSLRRKRGWRLRTSQLLN